MLEGASAAKVDKRLTIPPPDRRVSHLRKIIAENNAAINQSNETETGLTDSPNSKNQVTSPNLTLTPLKSVISKPQKPILQPVKSTSKVESKKKNQPSILQESSFSFSESESELKSSTGMNIPRNNNTPARKPQPNISQKISKKTPNQKLLEKNATQISAISKQSPTEKKLPKISSKPQILKKQKSIPKDVVNNAFTVATDRKEEEQELTHRTQQSDNESDNNNEDEINQQEENDD